jgi:hypothetical protein
MIALALATGLGAAANDPNNLLDALGRRASPSESASADITVSLDGSGLPVESARERGARHRSVAYIRTADGNVAQTGRPKSSIVWS